jgi:hypothetical protein
MGPRFPVLGKTARGLWLQKITPLKIKLLKLTFDSRFSLHNKYEGKIIRVIHPDYVVAENYTSENKIT